MEKEQNAKSGSPANGADSSEPVKSAFNPFATLSVLELAELANSFPKAFRDEQAINIALAKTEHQCSDNDAIFVAWLRKEVTSIMDRKAINDAVGAIAGSGNSYGLLRSVAMNGSSEVALDLIAGHYKGLKDSLKKQVGIRVRDRAVSAWESATVKNIMDRVYKACEVTEKDWMR